MSRIEVDQHTKFGEAWIIAVIKGNNIVEGTNPDFGIIERMHSHRADLFWVLSALNFLQEYCKSFFLESNSDITYYCDDLEVVDKIKWC